MKITCFGAGYVGLTTSACLANLGHNILCVDVDEKKIQKLQAGEVPFFEPNLDLLVKKNHAKGNLRFTTDVKSAVEFGDVVFNCVGTPSSDDGSADLSYVFAVAKTFGENLNSYKVFVNKSTVPPGTARETKRIIEENSKLSFEFDVVSNPEFLREGAAIYDFTHPDKIVIGAHSSRAFKMMREVYSGRLRTYLPIVETEWETAELIKYANNTFLATKISFINEIANICDRVGADVHVVAQALGLDYRISSRFLNAGVGFGGSCFPKDVRALTFSANQAGYPAKLLAEVTNLNERQKLVLFEKIKEAFGGNLAGKLVCMLGLSFKPKTSDVREAPSLVLIHELLKAGASVQVYDPEALDEVNALIGDKITYCKSPEEAVKNSHAIVLVTEWDEFRNLDLIAMRKLMADNKLFDGRNIYEPALAKEDGFAYYGIGRR
jgi:UDPglucose 6-dehydrogenase